MKRIKQRVALGLLVAIVIAVLTQLSVTGQSGRCQVRLLPGYRCKMLNTLGVNEAVGILSKEGGLSIEFERGISQGSAADASDLKRYAWYREQTVNGRLVKMAMIRKGLKTGWEPDRPRSAEFGNILLVTFPLSDQPNHAINFKAEILSEDELVDAILMILTFPSN